MFLQDGNIIPGMEKLEEKTEVLSKHREEKQIFREKVRAYKTHLDCCIQCSAIIHFFCHNTLDDALNFHFVCINHSEGSKVGATILNLKKNGRLILQNTRNQDLWSWFYNWRCLFRNLEQHSVIHDLGVILCQINGPKGL